MHNQSDAELVKAIQSGEISAFEIIVKRYQYGLHVFVMRYLRDSSAAADIVQETFISVYRVIDTIDTERKFTTLLFEIAKNKAISYLRTRKKLSSLSEMDDTPEEESFIESYLRADQADAVQSAVSALPQKYRDIIRLYYFEELSYEEISKKTGIPINTVRTHLKRAKEILKKTIDYEAI